MRDVLGVEAKTAAIQGKKHAPELQSIRGLAALVVVLHHCSFYFTYDQTLKHAAELALNAHAAVVCFFVLSGFVLHLSWGQKDLAVGPLGKFYVRRAFRIYPALWAACLFGVAYVALFHADPMPAVVDPWWHGESRFAAFSLRSATSTVVGNTTPLVIPIWTLRIELLGSLLLPFLTYAVSRSKAVFWGAATVLFLMAISPVRLGPLQFLVHFAFGVAVAHAAVRTRQRHSAVFYVTIAAAGFVAMWFGRTLFDARFMTNYNAPLPALIEGLGASAVIYAVYCSSDVFKWLRHSSLIWIGDISYSLYLVHLPLLGILGGLFVERFRLSIFETGGVGGTIALMIATVFTSLVTAALLYRYVEVPSIEAGKRLLARWEGRSTSSAGIRSQAQRS